MKVRVLSFSYKHGLPKDPTGNGGGFVFDCRAMPNPFWDKKLRYATGRDKSVREFFDQCLSRMPAVEVELIHAAQAHWNTLAQVCART